MKYEQIEDHRSRVMKYTQFMSELNFKPEWMPMKLASIPLFEAANPDLAINVLQYNSSPLMTEVSKDIYKNPFVDIIYRSKKTITPIYLVLVENGKNFLLNYDLN